MKCRLAFLRKQMSTRSSILRIVRAVLVIVGLVLFWLPTAAAKQDSDALRKAQLEVQRLGLEVEKLNDELGVAKRKLDLEVKKLETDIYWGPWIPVIGVLGGIVSGLFAAGVAMSVARRTRVGALDQATHEKRLESYPELMTATSPLAIYFPDLANPIWANTKSLDSHKCRAMGRAISKWYFNSGLLLSGEARDAYFRLARALTLAADAAADEEILSVPQFPTNAADISVKKLDRYRELLKIKNDEDVETWKFGTWKSDEPQSLWFKIRMAIAGMLLRFLNIPMPIDVALPADHPALKYKDYVFLQTLSSRLRTRLSEDLRSRRRPGSR
jgi:hypothetical protein